MSAPGRAPRSAPGRAARAARRRGGRSALGRVVRSGVGRRRVQTIVMTLTTLISVASAVLAAGLLVASDAPFDTAFARQRGAHLTAQFDPAKVSAQQLSATANTVGVTAAAGPFSMLTVQPRLGADAGSMAGVKVPELTVAGRATADGSVDAVSLKDGAWPTGPGQIVIATDDEGRGPRVGSQLTFPDSPGNPTLTVVGLATSVSRTAGAWVVPEQLTALAPAGTTPTLQMLYRFAKASTDAEITAGRAAITAAVPTDALTGAQSYLAIKQIADANTKAFIPFVFAFGVLGLVMSVLVIGVVISGAVSAGTRRIGILKSIGFTPAQVVRAYLGQAMIPGVIGAVLGVVAGNAAAIPVLATAREAYNTGDLVVAPWIDVVVPVAMLAVIALTAVAPALRAFPTAASRGRSA